MCPYNYNLMLKFSVPDGFLLRQITAVGFLIPKAATFNIFARSTLFLFNQFPVYLSAGQLAVLLRQSGQGEKAVALFQALLEINLFCPDFSGPGEYGFEDKVRDTYCTASGVGL